MGMRNPPHPDQSGGVLRCYQKDIFNAIEWQIGN